MYGTLRRLLAQHGISLGALNPEDPDSFLAEVVRAQPDLEPLAGDLHADPGLIAGWLEEYLSADGAPAPLAAEDATPRAQAEGQPQSQTARFAMCLATLAITRFAVQRMTQLLLPEAVIHRHAALPRQVLATYFAQSHFSLGALVGVVRHPATQARRFIAFTRTSAAVHALPLSPADQPADPAKLEAFGLPGTDMCVLRLSAFRDASAYTSALQAWAASPRHTLLLLIIDTHLCSLPKVNFARLKVEEVCGGADARTQDKRCILLLHFPMANMRLRNCYPALFLAGWEHLVLDSVGLVAGASDADLQRSLSVEECSKITVGLRTEAYDLRATLEGFLDKVVRVVASGLTYSGRGRPGHGASAYEWARSMLQVVSPAPARAAQGSSCIP
ncbi:MAG: hypothetical protein AAFS07_19155 [Pseudomonadota bacterium]